MRQTEYWRALLGAIILLLVLAFPGGIAGSVGKFFIWSRFLRKTGVHFSGKRSRWLGRVQR
jgi:branched-chain amino acid transport system permease protein